MQTVCFSFLVVATTTSCFGAPCNSPLETENYPTTIAAFFPAANHTTNWISLSTATPFLVRRIEMTHKHGENTSSLIEQKKEPFLSSNECQGGVLPDRIRISARVGAGDRTWYRDEHLSAWARIEPSFAAKDIVAFDMQAPLEFTNVTIWPTANSSGPLEFQFRVFGCPSASTRVVDFMFNSSSEAIAQSFSAVPKLEAEMIEILGKFVDPTRLVVKATFVRPQVLKVQVRILPDELALQSVDELARIVSSNPEILKTLHQVQGFVIDRSGNMCYQKVCPTHSVCVNGKCLNKNGDEISTALRQPALVEHNKLIFKPLITMSQQSSLSNGSGDVTTSRNTAALIVCGVVGAVILLILFRHGCSPRRRDREV